MKNDKNRAKTSEKAITQKREKPQKHSVFKAFCGGEEGIRSRLRARSGSALTCHRQVIHYRPVRIPTIKKPSHTQGMARLLWRRGRDSNPCGVAPKRFSRPPRYDRFATSPYNIYLILIFLYL